MRTYDFYISKAQEMIDAGFTTKAAQKNTLEHLGRAYDIIHRSASDRQRNELAAKHDGDQQAFFNAMRNKVDAPYSLAHVREAKHREAFTDREWAIVSKLAVMREVARKMEINKAPSKASVERAILQRSEIPKIAKEFEPIKPVLIKNYTDQVRRDFDHVTRQMNNDWKKINRLSYNHPLRDVWSFVRLHTDIMGIGIDAVSKINEDKVAKRAKEFADDQVGQFLYKLALKLVDLENVKLEEIDPYRMEFELVGELDDHKIRVVQNVKYTQSKYNKPFLQWPALIYVDGKRVSEKGFKDLIDARK